MIFGNMAAPNRYCTTNDKMIAVDREKICEWQKVDENSTFFSEFVNKGKMVILDKMHHEVSGTGYRCHAKRKDFTYRRSFFGVDTIEESEWISIKLTEKDW